MAAGDAHAAAGGLAVYATLRRGRGWPLAWLVPAALWVLVVCDHIAFNASAADPSYPRSVSSRVPQLVHGIWSATGHGFNRGWLDSWDRA